MGVLLGKGW